jgi:hypothetical protein
MLLDHEVMDAALTALATAIWRQVARDLTSRSPDIRAIAVAWLDSPAACTWACNYHADCDPDIIIQAVLGGTHRHVRHTRHTARRAG